MKCDKCSYESERDFAFCPNCGSPATKEEPVSSPQPDVVYSSVNASDTAVNTGNSVLNRFSSMFKDNLFLVICILMSASCGLALINVSFPVIAIIITVFLWMIFAQAKNGIVEAKYMRYISGAVFADYIVTWVLCGLVAFLGIMCFMLFAALGSDPDVVSALMSALRQVPGMTPALMSAMNSSIIVIAIIILFSCVIGAAAAALLNIFGIRTIHRFVKSAYQSVDAGQLMVYKVRAAKTWILVFGILEAVSAAFSITNFSAFLANGCGAAATIIGSVLIGKYFSDCE